MVWASLSTFAKRGRETGRSLRVEGKITCRVFEVRGWAAGVYIKIQEIKGGSSRG